MRISIGDFELADGTMSGGFALEQIRLAVDRIFDVVIPVPELLTEGTLVVGMLYRIVLFEVGDDFTNIGGTNVSGDVFIATGTTPTVWANESRLIGIAPVLFDRNVRRTIVDFQIARIHASMSASDIYAIDHDSMVPDSGLVQFTTTSGGIRWLLHAALISHQMVDLIGATTIHSYHIEGGQFHVPVFYRLLEDGSYRLLESGGRRELEN